MTIIVNETAVKVACICCGSEKYATQAPYLCHNCWKNGEAAKLIQQLTQRALDLCPSCAGKGTYQIGVYSETCDVCHGTGTRQ